MACPLLPLNPPRAEQNEAAEVIVKGMRTGCNSGVLAGIAIAAAVLSFPRSPLADEPQPVADTCVVASAPEHVTQPPVKVAVVQFSSAEGKPFTSCAVTVAPLKEAGDQLSRAVAMKLTAWPEYVVLDEDVVRKAVAKHHLAKQGLDTLEVVRKLAKLTGADAVVIGETDGTAWSGNGHEGGSLYASFRMLSTANAKVLWAVDGQVQDTRSTRDLVANLAADTTTRLFAWLQATQGGGLLAMNEPAEAE
jgi:hypothetical protein